MEAYLVASESAPSRMARRGVREDHLGVWSRRGGSCWSQVLGGRTSRERPLPGR